jgi:hypothetical protein
MMLPHPETPSAPAPAPRGLPACLPACERVRRVEFGPLAKTISVKIRRVELRDREAQAALPGAEPLTGEWRDSPFPELTRNNKAPITP